VKSILKAAFVCIFVLAVAGLMSAQLAPSASVSSFTRFNPPPCDFSDQFYGDNGLDVHQLVLRFGDNGGTTRLTGPPATGSQVNYVADPNCSKTDPTRRNFRILATTGGNADDDNSPFTNNTPITPEFISILAFLTNQTAFETTYSRSVGGSTISIANSQNPRGIAMQDVVGNFEAYAAVKQFTPQGFAANPCQADMQAPGVPTTPCFDLGSVNAVFTPNLRQNWRFATTRNAIDGSDGNCILNDPTVCGDGVTVSTNDAPFGYFCDDLLGMWIITYFWFTKPPNTTDPVCAPIFKAIGAKNGFNLDGTPVIFTAHELNDELEANGCGAEGQEAVDGTDGGAIWLVCPAIADPRNGGIATDAFLDVVRFPNGNAMDSVVLNAFSCLQKGGKFCNESRPE
jgi:hypothetical protein